MYCHAVGVSLVFKQEPLPNNSLVWLIDLFHITSNYNVEPTNSGPPPPRDYSLTCVTDLVECCESQGLGNWYYPDGRKVEIYSPSDNHVSYVSNRGQYEVTEKGTFYGSVRLFQRSRGGHRPSKVRGRFSCKLPDADNITQTLSAYISKFIIIIILLALLIRLMLLRTFTVETPTRGFYPVNISKSHSTSIAGDTGYSLECSITIYNAALFSDIPAPPVQWFKKNRSNVIALPFGVTPMPTTSNIDNDADTITYSST